MKNLKIIWGAPCSGKTTYCKSKMKDQDVVFDYDEIKKALTYKGQHDTSDWIRNLVQSIRFAWLRHVKDDDQINDAYMIMSRVSDNMKNFIEQDLKLKPEYHLVESTLEECLARLEKDGSRPDKERQIEKIKSWFQEDTQKEVKKMSKLQAKLEDGRQYRVLQSTMQVKETEKRIESDFYVEGYATVFQPYELYRDENGNTIFESFTRSCFDQTDMQDIIFQFDHTGRVYARKSNNTLIVEVDDHGLFVAADLSKSESARQLYGEIKEGLITKMSWGFRLGDYEYDKDAKTIKHKSVSKIYDVSAVSLPANEDTSISARTLVNGEIDKLLKERQEREKLLLEIELELL